MRNKQKVINLVLMLITTFLTLITVTFAWFIAINKTDDIIIEAGTLRVIADLYFGNDINKNGQIEEEEYEIIIDEIQNITNVIPGSVHHFKLVIKNTGSVPGHLSVDIINIIYSNEIMRHAFRVEYNDPTIDDEYTFVSMNIQNEHISMLDKYVIENESTYSFYFQIVGNDNISSDMSGHFLKISSFLITLDQIQNLKESLE